MKKKRNKTLLIIKKEYNGTKFKMIRAIGFK